MRSALPRTLGSCSWFAGLTYPEPIWKIVIQSGCTCFHSVIFSMDFIYCVSFFSIDQRFQSDLAGCPKPFWIMSRPRQCCSWSLPLPCCSSTSHRHGLPEARSSPAHAQDWMPLDEVDERMEKWINSLSPSCWYTKWNASMTQEQWQHRGYLSCMAHLRNVWIWYDIYDIYKGFIWIVKGIWYGILGI